jgi:hypothetical protein
MSTIFDLYKPAVKAVRSTFGGGWAFPLTDEGKKLLRDYFGEDPSPLEPFGGEEGYIVEPHMSGELAVQLRDANLAWVVE